MLRAVVAAGDNNETLLAGVIAKSFCSGVSLLDNAARWLCNASAKDNNASREDRFAASLDNGARSLLFHALPLLHATLLQSSAWEMLSNSEALLLSAAAVESSAKAGDGGVNRRLDDPAGWHSTLRTGESLRGTAAR